MTELYIVRLYDGFDNRWIDISKAVDKLTADKIWSEKTGNGTKNTKYNDIDYYRIFPADTRMLFSDSVGERA
jgi:hypothetical protein